MNGRIYAPQLGRMLSPDPVTQAPDNGQNYNRYSYAYNNPLKFTDPNGFQATPAGWIASSAVYTIMGLGGGSDCGASCREWWRDAYEWCKSTSCQTPNNPAAAARASEDLAFNQASQPTTSVGQSYSNTISRVRVGDVAAVFSESVSSADVVGEIVPRDQLTNRQIRVFGALAKRMYKQIKSYKTIKQMVEAFPELASLDNNIGNRINIRAYQEKMLRDLREMWIHAIEDTVLSSAAVAIAVPADIALGGVSKAYGTLSTVKSALESGGFFEDDFEVFVGCSTGPVAGCTGGVIIHD